MIDTAPADWSPNGVDLCRYIGQVNAIKSRHPVFREESQTEFLSSPNPNILLMRKRSARDGKDSLLTILNNKDPWHYQEFYTDRFQPFLPAGASLRDMLAGVSPSNAFRSRFTTRLRPGQGIVLTDAADN